MNSNLYKVRYTNAEGKKRQSNVRGFDQKEATAKARKFIANGGALISVENTYA